MHEMSEDRNWWTGRPAFVVRNQWLCGVMKAGYAHALRQTGSLNQVMMLAVKVMRMTGVELREHLTDTIERNPLVEVERGQKDTGAGAASWGTQDLPNDARNSLYRHIADQFHLVFHSNREIEIALAFLQEIEPSGWLAAPAEHIAEVHGFALWDCQSVLDRLQSLEPAGVFARDLKDCLRLQAIDRGQFDDVMETLIAHLDHLMTCDVATLARRLKSDPKEFALRLDLIRRMDPKPGSAFSFDETVLRGSDVILQVTEQEVTIELSGSSFPSVRLSHGSDADGPGGSQDASALKNLVQEARALQTAVEMRKSTTLSVVGAIFARQQGFLANGYAALAPMGMSDIADDIGVSEATVSRILSGLTIQCPLGCISAKSLFCSPVPYCDQPRTKHAALQMIKDLVAGEDRMSPLGDQEIAHQMKRSGFDLSRRTVTKYRQFLGLDAPAIRRKSAELSALVVNARAADLPSRDNQQNYRHT